MQFLGNIGRHGRCPIRQPFIRIQQVIDTDVVGQRVFEHRFFVGVALTRNGRRLRQGVEDFIFPAYFFFDSEFFHCIFELVSFSRSFFTLLFLFGSDSCFFFLFDFQLFLQAHQRSKRLFIDIHFR